MQHRSQTNKVILYALSLLLALSLPAAAQQVTGDWYGLLNIPGSSLRVVFHISQVGDAYSATMDSPDQSAYGIPVTTTRFENRTLTMTVTSLSIDYLGIMEGDSIVRGTFRQSGRAFALNLTREPVNKPIVVRPQDPKPPYPYSEEDVVFPNTADDITLAGTLTLPPKGEPFTAVVLISGSGPQNRNEELMGHKPFLILADHLTRAGIAVLRFDDRGTGKSTGNFSAATTRDFARDVQAAIDFLKTRKEINPGRIGLVGHSEGGLIAPMVAASSNDVAFVAMLAGPGIRGKELLVLQSELISRTMGLKEELIQGSREVNEGIFDLIVNTAEPDSLRHQIAAYLRKALKEHPHILAQSGMDEDAFVNMQATALSSPWMEAFVRYDPAPVLEKVTCPVLALFGEKDLQVPPDPNAEAVTNALKRGGNSRSTVEVLPGLNHLFQEAHTGSPAEYGVIEQTMSPLAMDALSSWIQGLYP
ncbi:MAG TPA: alpha/beta hydrolase [Cyclobacteriaceae bacterium]